MYGSAGGSDDYGFGEQSYGQQQQQQQQQYGYGQQQYGQQQYGQPQASVPMGAYGGGQQQQQQQQQQWQQPQQPQQPQQQQQAWQYQPAAEPAGHMQPQAGAYGGQLGQPGAYGGQMGQMHPQPGADYQGMAAAPVPPKVAGSGNMARNISATLLGEGEPDEPPILEELGINFAHIMAKTKAVMLPRRSKLSAEVVNDSDFAGPILFCLVLGTLLLFNGKVHFGYIYGVFVVGLLGLWSLLNLMSDRGIDIYRTASIMGYCLLPIVALAALSIPVDLRGALGAPLVALAVGWCSNAAALFFVISLEADDRRWCAPRACHASLAPRSRLPAGPWIRLTPLVCPLPTGYSSTRSASSTPASR